MKRNIRQLLANIVTFQQNRRLRWRDIGSSMRKTWSFATSANIKQPKHLGWGSTETDCTTQQSTFANRVTTNQTRGDSFTITTERFTEASHTTVRFVVSKRQDQETWGSIKGESTAGRDFNVFFATLETRRRTGWFFMRREGIQQCWILHQRQKLTEECRFCTWRNIYFDIIVHRLCITIEHLHYYLVTDIWRIFYFLYYLGIWTHLQVGVCCQNSFSSPNNNSS